jgi:hypothetical protein
MSTSLDGFIPIIGSPPGLKPKEDGPDKRHEGGFPRFILSFKNCKAPFQISNVDVLKYPETLYAHFCNVHGLFITR